MEAFKFISQSQQSDTIQYAIHCALCWASHDATGARTGTPIGRAQQRMFDMTIKTTTIDRDTRSGRFLTGCKPGPGRQLGSRNKLAENFIADLHATWEEHGAAALAKCAVDEPAQFVRVVASLMPKDINLTVGVDAATFVRTFREARAALGNTETQRTHRRSPVNIEHDDAG